MSLNSTEHVTLLTSRTDSIPVCPEIDPTEGLKLIETVPRDEDSDDEEEKSEDGRIDLLHVTGIDQDRLNLSKLGLYGCRARVMEFEPDLSGLFHHSSFAMNFIEYESRRLLRGLTYFRHQQARPTPIVVVAYDLGSLIVKKAVAIAKQELVKWPDVLTSLEVLIFSGCFQRGDEQMMRTKMFKFLIGQPDGPRKDSLTLDIVLQMASVTRDINELFMDSKITSRSKILSLYANSISLQGRLNKVFDEYTATLGISTEFTFVENVDETKEGRVSELSRNVRFSARAISNVDFREHELQVAQNLELALMGLAPRDCVMISSHREPSLQELLAHDSYQAWAERGGLQILCIYDPEEATAIKAAEQVSRTWRAPTDRQATNASESQFLYFTFSAQDHRCNSIMALHSTIILRALTESSEHRHRLHLQALTDQHGLFHSWNERDLLNLASICQSWKYSSLNVKLLAKLHECEERDRQEFWSFLAKEAARVEVPMKIVLPSSKQSLLKEVSNRPELKSHVQHLQVSDIIPGTSNIPSDTSHHQHILAHQHQPWTHVLDAERRHRLESSLVRLRETMGEESLADVVKICSIQTRWHDRPSPKSFSSYCDLIEKVEPQSTPSALLSSLIQSTCGQFDAQFALSWVLCGCRMLTLNELSMLLDLHSTNRPRMCPDEAISAAAFYIQNHMHVILDTSGNRVKIRGDVERLLDVDSDRIWTRAKRSGLGITVDFLFHYFTIEWVQERVQRLWMQYQDRISNSNPAIMNPLVEDGRDVTFYCIQALPHHILAFGAPDISKDTKLRMQDPQGPFQLWTNLFWAMSNPFSRPLDGPWRSAWEAVASRGQSSMASMLHANVTDTEATDLQELTEDYVSQSDCVTELVEVVRRRHDAGEARALSLAREIVERQATQDTTIRIPWNPLILWQAVWYGMLELVEYLLDNGVGPDDFNDASSYSPSPLYLAARLGHYKIMRALLQHKADSTVRRDGRDVLDAAIRSGEVQAIKTLVDHGSSITSEAVYLAATEGLYEVVEMLLSHPLRASPQSRGPDGCFAVTGASDRGYINSLRLLLENNGDNDIEIFQEALLAAVKSRSGQTIECVRLLLAHGADPNDAQFQTPLALSIVRDTVTSSDQKLAILQLLANHRPSLDVNAPDSDGFRPLMVAAADGDVAVLRWLLDNGAQVDATNDNGAYALYFAVQEEKFAAVNELLRQEPAPRLDLQTPSDTNDTTLLEAAVHDDLGVLRLLIDSGANLEITDEDGSTILTTSVCWRRADAVKMLLDKGANLHHRNRNGLTPILASVQRDNEKVVRILAEAGANLSDLNRNGSNPVHLAAWEALPNVLRILLEFRKYDIEARDDDDDTPLLSLVELNQPECLECLKILLRAGAEINAQRRNSNRRTLLTRAAAFDNSDSTESSSFREFIETLLCTPGIDLSLVEKGKGTALHIACGKQDADLVVRLLDSGADINMAIPNEVGTCLSSACIPNIGDRKMQDIHDLTDQIVRILVLRGANVNAVAGHTMFTALSVAAWSASVNTVNYLVDSGASVTTSDPLGRLPIHFASGNGILNFEALALTYNGDIMVGDVRGKNVLHWAAQYGHVETLRAILGKVYPKAERMRLINYPDKDGWTPLAWASRPDLSSYRLMSEPRDYSATVRYLIAEGANTSVKFCVNQADEDQHGVTPLVMAQRCGASKDVVELLGQGDESIESRDSLYLPKEERRYRYHDGWWCDICLMGIFGVVYQCDVCPYFTICSKCHGSIDVYHEYMRARDGQQHNFFSPPGRDKDSEFIDSDSGSSRSTSVASERISQNITGAGFLTRHNTSRSACPSESSEDNSLGSFSSDSATED